MKKTVVIDSSDSAEMAAKVLFDAFEPAIVGILLSRVKSDPDFGVRFLGLFTARVIGFFAGVAGREAADVLLGQMSATMHSAPDTRRQH